MMLEYASKMCECNIDNVKNYKSTNEQNVHPENANNNKSTNSTDGINCIDKMIFNSIHSTSTMNMVSTTRTHTHRSTYNTIHTHKHLNPRCRFCRQNIKHRTLSTHPYSKHIVAFLLLFAVIFSQLKFTHSRSTMRQVRPMAAPLLANAALTPTGTSGPLSNTTQSALLLRQKLSIETNSIQRQIEVSPHGDHSRSLKRVFLSNRTITCNDGSQAGFYLRKNPHSKKWIVFLEGGWHCYDTRSCRARWLRLRHLMTSAQWPETRDVGGILSPLADDNPYWHNANHVLVPYCSSDSWSGTRAVADSRENNWRFMGALILQQVISDLIPLGLGRATGAELLLVGSSAGGLGVMLNLDRVTKYLQQKRNLLVTVRGVSDSGWFLDREPYTPGAVAASEAVRQGWKLWKGQVPEECGTKHTAEPWRCYFGYRLYPTLKAPLFVFQWLFDEAQMRADNVGAPVTPQQWNYIHEMGGALRSSLDNVTAVFAPSCIGHAVLSKRDWVNIRIDDISLPAALRCWEHSTRPRRKRHDKLKRSTEATLTHGHKERTRHNKQHENRETNDSNNNNSNKNNPPKRVRHHLTKEQREERKRRKQENQQRRREQRNRRQRNRKANNAKAEKDRGNSLPNSHSDNDTEAHGRKQKHHRRNKIGEHNGKRTRQGDNKRRHKNKETENQNQNQNTQNLQLLPGVDALFQHEEPANTADPQRKSSANFTNGRSRVPRVPEKCGLRLLERCSWPQCNHSCPTLTNPLTGEEMRFLELLTSFGLDIEAVAAALGVDMHTLNNMDRTELVNLLTQQVS